MSPRLFHSRKVQYLAKPRGNPIPEVSKVTLRPHNSAILTPNFKDFQQKGPWIPTRGKNAKITLFFGSITVDFSAIKQVKQMEKR